jgi:hypothetical protein
LNVNVCPKEEEGTKGLKPVDCGRIGGGELLVGLPGVNGFLLLVKGSAKFDPPVESGC